MSVIATVEWTVNVEKDEVPPDATPVDVARRGYDHIVNSGMPPILLVKMPDGTKHEVDLLEEGLA